MPKRIAEKSREVARLLGDATYISGTVCKNCHTAERYTVNGACVGCTKKKARARYATPEGKRVQNNRDRKRYRDLKEGTDDVFD